MTALEHQVETHQPFPDDGVTYCGWATGSQVIDGCGEVWPCSTVRRSQGVVKATFGSGGRDCIRVEVSPSGLRNQSRMLLMAPNTVASGNQREGE